MQFKLRQKYCTCLSQIANAAIKDRERSIGCTSIHAMAPVLVIITSFTILGIAFGALADGLTISIPAGNPSDLQDYLCNGSLSSNTTLQLQQGVHVISREGFCSVDVRRMNIRLTGAGMRETTINCTRKWGFGFSSAQNVVVEGLAFDSCGAAVDLYNNITAVLYLNSSHSVSMSNVSFQVIFLALVCLAIL